MLMMMMMGNNRNSGGNSGILQMMLGLGMINPLMFLAMSAGDGLGDDDDMQKYLDKQVRINVFLFYVLKQILFSGRRERESCP